MFVFNDTATTEIYTYLHTLSLHDARPSCAAVRPLAAWLAGRPRGQPDPDRHGRAAAGVLRQQGRAGAGPAPPDVIDTQRQASIARSEEHTSELQSLMRIS